jgi:plasmid stabilization system protein ParE
VAESYRVNIQPEASADLVATFEFIERDSPQNAVSMMEAIFASIDSLKYFPHRSKVHRSARKPTRVVYAMSVEPFIIYYRIREADRVVEVLTVRHGARKQPRRFK